MRFKQFSSLVTYKEVLNNSLLTIVKAPFYSKLNYSRCIFRNGITHTLREMNTKPVSNVEKRITICDQQSGLQYTPLPTLDPFVNKLMSSVRTQRRFDKHRILTLEGHRLIKEAFECHLQLKALFFHQIEDVREFKNYLSPIEPNIYKISKRDLRLWSNLSTTPGIMALFSKGTEKDDVNKLDCLPITVVCDNIREPNNLGSIIRTCAAIPCMQVVIIKGCCDPWDPKTLRGSCGAHFRISIKDNMKWENLHSVLPEDALNSCVLIAENDLSKISKDIEVINYRINEKLGLHNILIVGGESQGVGPEAYEFYKNSGMKGRCLHIPLARGIDSLNVSTATALILYELKHSLKHT